MGAVDWAARVCSSLLADHHLMPVLHAASLRPQRAACTVQASARCMRPIIACRQMHANRLLYQRYIMYVYVTFAHKRQLALFILALIFSAWAVLDGIPPPSPTAHRGFGSNIRAMPSVPLSTATSLGNRFRRMRNTHCCPHAKFSLKRHLPHKQRPVGTTRVVVRCCDVKCIKLGTSRRIELAWLLMQPCFHAVLRLRSTAATARACARVPPISITSTISTHGRMRCIGHRDGVAH